LELSSEHLDGRPDLLPSRSPEDVASFHGKVGIENLVSILFERCVRCFELSKSELGQFPIGLDALRNELAYDPMGVSKRYASCAEVISELCGEHMASFEGCTHTVGSKGHACHDSFQNFEGCNDRVKSVKDGGFILLHVSVVSEGQPLHEHEE